MDKTSGLGMKRITQLALQNIIRILQPILKPNVEHFGFRSEDKKPRQHCVYQHFMDGRRWRQLEVIS